MAKGIVVKIWNINAGNGQRTSAMQMNDSIDYIFNDEKCSVELSEEPIAQMMREMTYVTNDLKTLQGLLVGGRHMINVSDAVSEMLQVKNYYGKNNGRIALHGMISVDKEESDPENAIKLMQLVCDLMKNVFPDNQCVYAVHTNTEHLHVHFIVNTVGLDGKKIHMDKDFMAKRFQPEINKLAPKYGFTPNPEWGRTKEKDPLSFVERKIKLRQAIDLAIEETEDFEGFVKHLKREGMSVGVGKYLSLRSSEMPYAMRTKQLGANYTLEAIRERIRTKRYELVNAELSTNIAKIRKPEILYYSPRVIKKYEDMSVEEKDEVIHMLRVGKNPWRIIRETNWRMKKAVDELSMAARISELVQFYASEDGNIESAKQGIVATQQALRNEIKEIRKMGKKYKPIVDIYQEMKRLETRAYLYEDAGYLEYAEDYERYKSLAERLEKNYGKSVLEVANFCKMQETQLLYVKAQSEELNKQYKAIVNYQKNRMHRQEQSPDIFEAVGHTKAKELAYYGVFSSRLVYITSAKNSDLVLRVMTTPDIVDGKNTVTTTVAVLDAKGNVIEEHNSAEMGKREFNKFLLKLKYEKDFEECEVHEKESDVKNRGFEDFVPIYKTKGGKSH